jgi:class 3 adenylate cyclase/HAMP domain-containing protein
MRLRPKIILAFFLVSGLVCLVLTLFLHRFIERQLGGELKARLRNMVYLGSQVIDRDAYDRLRVRISAELGAHEVAAVERSADYALVTEQLDVIRSAEADLVRFAYILVPTDDPGQARFVVDADVRQAAAAGEEISHFNKLYDVSRMPKLRRALAECVPVVEDEFVYDPMYGVRSVSAYHPIGGEPGTCLGVLGVDLTDKRMRAALNEAGNLAIRVSVAIIALALLVSIGMGAMLTRSVMALSATVKRFAEKDFAARTAIQSRDEIGQLGQSFNAMAEIIQLHSENLEHLIEERTSELYAEKQTSERLLLKVLPAPIAERLKRNEGLIVDRFDQVTVLFADIVGFTALSSSTTPEVLVTMLDELFSVFDHLAEVHGVEKIKTIGDVYMAVAGIPEPRDNHAVAVARMALAMQTALQDFAARNGSDLAIRIGIHTGSVVAGVIGRKKFIYDLWGDTVNIASRMGVAWHRRQGPYLRGHLRVPARLLRGRASRHRGHQEQGVDEYLSARRRKALGRRDARARGSHVTRARRAGAGGSARARGFHMGLGSAIMAALMASGCGGAGRPTAATSARQPGSAGTLATPPGPGGLDRAETRRLMIELRRHLGEGRKLARAKQYQEALAAFASTQAIDPPIRGS